MNKMVKMAIVFVALAAMFSFAEEGMKYGVRAGFSLYDYSSGEGEMDKYVNKGYGFGAGFVANIPIASSLSFAPEVNFLYRKPMIVDLDGVPLMGYKIWVTEFAISIFPMLRFTPSESTPFYLTAGALLDVPIASKRTKKSAGNEVTENYEDRSSLDFGIPLGLGYLIIPNLGVDLRAVIGITSPKDDSESKDSWNQYGLGLTYYF